MEEMMTTDEVAGPIRTTAAGVRWQIDRGTGVGPLFRKFGKRWLARRADVEAYVAGVFDG